MAASGGDALAAGTMIGGYRVEYRVGGGGMGTVYAAEEPRIKKRVAIKVLRHGLADDPASATRFEREARAANDVRHPAIVDVFAFGKLDDGRPYLVMSLLEGKSLRDEIAERGRIPLADAWAWTREVAEALAAAHEIGVVHRDLKPDNVFIERFGGRPARPRLLDLGLVKLTRAPDDERPGDGDAMKLTATGTPMGTPRYMAPEQWWGAEVDARADQYALGVTLFEMLAGRPPFTAQQFMELGQQHMHAPPPTLASAGIVVPGAVESLVARALAKAPTDRFASMTALIEAGDAAFRGATDEVSLAATQAVSSVGATTAPRAPPPSAPRALAPPLAAPALLRRFLGLHAIAVIGGPAGLVAIGYAGDAERDVREWFVMAGWFIWGVVAAYLGGAIAAVTSARRRATTGVVGGAPWVLAIAVAACGALGTYLGWQKTSGGIATFRAPIRFEILHQGIYELELNRFVGFFLASVLFVSLAAAAGLSAAPSPSETLVEAIGVRRRESLAAALGLVALAVASSVLGARSGTLLAAASAAVVAVDLALPLLDRRTAAAAEIERAVAGGAALGLLASAGLSRVDARQAVLWHGAPTRAARAAEIVLAAQERQRTLLVGAISLLVVAGVEVIRLRRVFRSGGARGDLGRPLTLLGVVAALGIADAAMHHGFAATREAVHAELAPQFSLFARLDPPSSAELDPEHHVPRRAPALQIARNVVAVNAKASTPLLAVDSEDGASNLSRDLSHALADQAAHADDGDGDEGTKGHNPTPIDLAVSVDRTVRWRVVDRLLGIAHRAGVRHIELYLTRGPALDLPAGAPPEASWVLARDFVALRVDLEGPEHAGDAAVFRAGDDEPFGDVAPGLVRRALEGEPVRVAPR